MGPILSTPSEVWVVAIGGWGGWVLAPPTLVQNSLWGVGVGGRGPTKKGRKRQCSWITRVSRGVTVGEMTKGRPRSSLDRTLTSSPPPSWRVGVLLAHEARVTRSPSSSGPAHSARRAPKVI
jgi:hypothetical protein